MIFKHAVCLRRRQSNRLINWQKVEEKITLGHIIGEEVKEKINHTAEEISEKSIQKIEKVVGPKTITKVVEKFRGVKLDGATYRTVCEFMSTVKKQSEELSYNAKENLDQWKNEIVDIETKVSESMTKEEQEESKGHTGIFSEAYRKYHLRIAKIMDLKEKGYTLAAVWLMLCIAAIIYIFVFIGEIFIGLFQLIFNFSLKKEISEISSSNKNIDNKITQSKQIIDNKEDKQNFIDKENEKKTN